MTSNKILVTLIALTLCLLAGNICGQTPGASESPGADVTRLRLELEPKINDAISKGPLPGFAIGVVKNGKLIYAKGFGVAKLGTSTPVTSRSLFHMASVTKTFVATAVMQLVEQGKIDLDAPITKYLTYFKMDDERYRDIRVRQMLSHISGIPDTANYHWDQPEYDDGALERFVRSTANQKLIFSPGEKFAYSNTAYEILGDLISKVSGETFEDYVQHHILTPLGMKDSTLFVRQANASLLTSPHVEEGGKPVVSKVFPYNRAHAPSSTLYSNIDDMSRWAIANLNHGELDGRRILKRETAELMWQPVVMAFNMKEGISWFTKDLQGHLLVMHDGGDVGFQSRLLLAPDDSVAIIAMANYAAANKEYLQFATDALKIMLDLKPAAPATTTANTSAPAVLTEETKQKADEVLAAYVKGLGGRTALEKINSRIAKGTFEVLGLALSGPAELLAKAPNKMLTILTVPGQTTLKEGFDGTVGWQQDPDDGVVDKAGLELGSAMRDADFYQPLKLRAQYPNLFFKGQVRVALFKANGERGLVYELSALQAPRNNYPRIFYFDPTTGLLLRIEERNAANQVISATELDDYREVDGVKVPFVIHHVDDAHFLIKLTEVKQNVTIDDAIFVKPKK
jgi:CubicO group peptidase (beta-lactamase class C family)